MKSKFLIALIILILLLTTYISAENRVALVIGNANYVYLGKLKNPINDANDIAATLSSLGFEVTKLIDSSLIDLENAVLAFKEKLAQDRNNVGIFYYAGHGVQSSYENFLIPSDAKIQSEQFLKVKSLSLQTVLDLLQSAHNKLNVVILDACRDNPFGWSRSGVRGLSVVGRQPPGSIIVYSTSSGEVAQDGTGKNSVFADALLKTLTLKSVEIKEVFNKAGLIVQNNTHGEQIPAVYNQFFESYYLTNTDEVSSSIEINPHTNNQIVPRDSLLIELLFTGNTLDTSAKKNIITSYNIQYSKDRFNRDYNAIILNGIDSYIDCSDQINLIEKSFSISMWFKRDAINGNHQDLIGQGFNQPYCVLHFGFRSDDTILLDFYLDGITTKGTYPDNTKWHHIVGMYDYLSKSSTIFLDGKEIANAYINHEYKGFGNFYIGRNGANNIQYFSGQIDDIRIYNRILTKDEILALFEEQ